MADFCDVTGIKELLPAELATSSDIEVIYSKVSANSSFDDLRKKIESTIASYFDDLTLPEHPTIYDKLVLSMRPKDVIATFNWDPLLYQALDRCYSGTEECPTVLALHGNVALAFCEFDQRIGLRGSKCNVCGRKMEPTALLFPTSQKNYSLAPSVAFQWEGLRSALGCASFVTVFGYGAPTTDADAMRMIQDAWGEVDSRSLEQFEFIDIRNGDEVKESWEHLVHSHHFQTCFSFDESSLNRHPRRTVENLTNRTLRLERYDDPPIPHDFDCIGDLINWFRTLRKHEFEIENA